MENKLWFKRKLYGWGWYPASWQGWVATAIYAIAIIYFAQRVESNTSFAEQFWPFLFPLFVLTLLFVLLASWKGERPKWQWGKPNEEVKTDEKAL